MTSTGIGLFDPQYWNRAAEIERDLREQAPVHRATTPEGLPVWVLNRYEDAREALTDPRLAKDADRLREVMLGNAHRGGVTELSGLFAKHMLTADPPDHTRLRKLLARDFTPRRIAALRPHVEALVAQLLDELATGEPVDLVERFAYPVPITVISELMGIPEDDRDQFRAWTAALLNARQKDVLEASREMGAFFTELIRQKRARPGEDLLSALTLASEDGDRLTGEELLGTAFLLIVAGHETTVNLIGNGAKWLLGERSGWTLLHERPDLVPGAVEELLRFDGPLRMSTYRFTAEPVDIDGTTIPAGELVLVNLTSANRDSARFPDADELDLRRGGGHIAFGHGIHHCLGAPLARLEGEIALGALTRRFPRARLAVAEDELRRGTTTVMNGFASLPVVLDPA